MPASMSAALPTPSPSANAASLITWQTIRPSTRPGRVADPDVCLPSVAKKRSAASAADAALSGPRVSSTSVSSRSGGSAWKPTAPPPGSSAASEPAAQQIACGPPCSGASGSSPAGQIEDQERRVALARPRRAGDLPAGLGGRRAQLERQRRLAGDHDHAVAAADAAAARGRRGR